MNFDKLPPIESGKVYLNNAFSKARTKADAYSAREPPQYFAKSVTRIKIDTVTEVLQKSLKKIIDEYPNFDDLNEFYTQLIKSQLNFKALKKSLGACSWAYKQVSTIARIYQKKISGTQQQFLARNMTEYYGRISSVIKQISPELTYLQEARKILRTFPSVKEEFTICISGFPNVGKSTLLSKITPASPEISNYAFTTKTLNMGYAKRNGITYQFIDTPGTLNRIEKMNQIEHLAHLVMKYLANVLVYVFDLTESAYSVKDQLKLLKASKQLDKPIFCYIAKTDITDPDDIESFLSKEFANKKIPVFTDFEELLAEIATHYKKENKA